MTYQIRYVLVPDLNVFAVSLIGRNQRIIVQPRFFCRMTGVSDRAVLGCRGVTAEEATALGFIVKEVAAV